MWLLGVSCYYHDSAAVLISNGEIIAAAQEERFTRRKHDASFPVNAIRYCLKQGKIDISELNAIVFYEDPKLKWKRILKTYRTFFPKSIPLIFKTFLPWFTKKRLWKKQLLHSIQENFNYSFPENKLHNIEHHLSHAASAFLASNFEEAAILVVDGVGESTTTSIWKGDGNKIDAIEQIHFPNSLGLLYSALTYYTGFKVNSGEYKVMGLAPYGNPIYVDKIKNHLINIHEDGSYELNMDYFDFAFSDYMTNKRFHKLFGGDPREPESLVTQKEMDIARSLQEVLEEAMLKLVKRAVEKTGSKNLCLAGGVALNCVANGKILKSGLIDDIWIQPAAGDAGGALGAALYYYYSVLDNKRKFNSSLDLMQGAYLGPSFSIEESRSELDSLGAVYHELNENELFDVVADKINEGYVIGWFQGRMEFGPRALGNRSIIGDARKTDMQKIMNLKIKFRESFRPFAPAVLAEECDNYFELSRISPYMLLVAQIKDSLKVEVEDDKLFGIDKLNQVRSQVPAITHVDYSARVQTVHESTNPVFYRLIKSFYNKSGSPVIINTSFNVRGEPIVCSITDAYRCFMRTGIDILVVNNMVMYKTEQPNFKDTENWQQKYELD